MPGARKTKLNYTEILPPKCVPSRRGEGGRFSAGRQGAEGQLERWSRIAMAGGRARCGVWEGLQAPQCEWRAELGCRGELQRQEGQEGLRSCGTGLAFCPVSLC